MTEHLSAESSGRERPTELAHDAHEVIHGTAERLLTWELVGGEHERRVSFGQERSEADEHASAPGRRGSHLPSMPKQLSQVERSRREAAPPTAQRPARLPQPGRDLTDRVTVREAPNPLEHEVHSVLLARERVARENPLASTALLAASQPHGDASRGRQGQQPAGHAAAGELQGRAAAPRAVAANQ